MGRVIGTLPCRGIDCGEKVAVSETGGGSLSLKCSFCGFSPYAPPGSKAARQIRKHMVSVEEPDPAPAPAPAPVPKAPKPQPVKSPPKTPEPSTAFDLGQLT